MEIVLGLSITGTTARLALVEGERADGVTIESEVFDTAAPESVPKPSPTEQVSNAILATPQNALANGHHLVVSGVTWDGPTQQAELRESMTARGLDDVVLVPEQSAAGALAQTIGRVLGVPLGPTQPPLNCRSSKRHNHRFGHRPRPRHLVCAATATVSAGGRGAK
jgi:hypothetical protein